MQWCGTDDQEQPILLLTPARALGKAKPPPMEQGAEAIVSQVYHGIHRMLDSNAQASGLMVVVVDARGVSGMQVRVAVSTLQVCGVRMNYLFWQLRGGFAVLSWS